MYIIILVVGAERERERVIERHLNNAIYSIIELRNVHGHTHTVYICTSMQNVLVAT